MMEILKTATLLLDNHAAWFIVVILSTVVVTLARYVVKLFDTQREDDRTTISMLEGFKASVDALTKAIDRLLDKS